MKNHRTKRTKISQQIILAVLERFFEGSDEESKATNIAKYINSRFQPPEELTRESIYPIIRKAKSLGFIQIYPPLDTTLSSEIASKYGHDSEDIVVVNIKDPTESHNVARQAAVLAIKLIKEMGVPSTKNARSIGLGLGPGRATLDFSRYLSGLLRHDSKIPPLSLYAISTGSPINQPEYAPISFFNLFSNSFIDKRIGFFAESIVPHRFFEEMKKRPVLSEVFDKKNEIDIIVTSMGDIDDEHDLLRTLLVKSGYKISELKSKGWIGNVQFRPYTREGAIQETGDELRAVTLFEIDDFVEMAKRKKKHVLLIARQCCLCGKERSKSLRPLLENPKLKVWSKLIIDIPTARGLMPKD